jgi:hypothetical protein
MTFCHYLLTCIASSGTSLAIGTFRIIYRDELHHHISLYLISKVEVPVAGRIDPVKLEFLKSTKFRQNMSLFLIQVVTEKFVFIFGV